jgi:fructokinase
VPFSNPPPIVVAGEALIDLVPGSVVGSYQASPGGGPANAAVALARLGAHAMFLGRLSRDAFGEQLFGWLSSNAVDLSLTVRSNEPTTIALATVDSSGIASYSFYWRDTANWQWSAAEIPTELPAGTQAFHLGSLASVVEPGASILGDLLQRCVGNITTFVDPNFRPQMDTPAAAAHRVSQWVARCDIAKVSVDDLAFAFPDREPLAIAQQWSTEHRVLVLVTDGPRGAHAFVDGDHLHADASSRPVVDTIGAGDSFGAAFLYALQALDELGARKHPSRQPVQTALEFACAAADVTCERLGADSPRLDDLPAAVVRALQLR